MVWAMNHGNDKSAVTRFEGKQPHDKGGTRRKRAERGNGMGRGRGGGNHFWGHAEKAEAGLKFGDCLVLVRQHVRGLAPQLQQCSCEARNLPDAS